MDQCVGELVALGSPEQADRLPGRGDASDTGRFGEGEAFVVAIQSRLVDEEGRDGIHQAAAEVNVTDLENRVAAPLALMGAGVVAAADQTRAAEHLGGFGVVGRIADGGRQAGSLNRADAFEFRPDLIRGLGDELGKALFERGNVSLNSFKQRQIVLQQFAANGSQL